MACTCKFDGDNKAPAGLEELMCVKVGDHGEGKTVAMMEVKKGWKWSEHMKPIVKTDSCQKAHFGVLMSGKIKVWMDDKSELTIEAGQSYYIPPGHDAEALEDIKGFEFADNHATK